MLHLTVASRDIDISNVYAPNSPGQPFFQDLTFWDLKIPEHFHLIGGCFNTVMHMAEDHTSGSASRVHTGDTPTILAESASSLHLTNIWRISHPTDSFPSIDYLFCSPGILPSVSSSIIEDMVISDHSPVSLQVSGFLTPRNAGT